MRTFWRRDRYSDQTVGESHLDRPKNARRMPYSGRIAMNRLTRYIGCLFGVLGLILSAGCSLSNQSRHHFRHERQAESVQCFKILADRPGHVCNRTVGFIWPETKTQSPVDYVPCEGDIVLMTSRSFWYTCGYLLARSGHPFHAGLVVRRNDDTLALLEACGDRCRSVSITPLKPRLLDYLDSNTAALIWVRARKRPLAAQQSAMLTQFAELQNGKPFGYFRLATYLLPIRPRLAAKPDQSSWYCSELSVAALESAGLLDGDVPSSSILPNEIFHNRRINLNDGWLPAKAWAPHQQLADRRPLLAPR